MPWYSKLLVVLAFSGVCLADNVTFLRIDSSVVQQRAQQAPATIDQRVQVLRSMFEKAGCGKTHVEVQAVPDQQMPNVICTLPGTEYGTILVAARLDYDTRGQEGEVGWAGVAMLPLLAESLTSTNHRHTLVFAAFSGSNMAGAAWYWKNLSDAQRREFRGVVDLDHLGRTAVGYSTTSDGAVMARLLPAAARALQINPEPRPLADVSDGDALLFQRAHIPAITIYSAGFVSGTEEAQKNPADMNPLLPADVHKVPPSGSHAFALKTELDPAVYNQTYNLLCVYMLFLDRGLGASRRPETQVMTAKSEGSSAPKPLENAVPATGVATPANTAAPGVVAANLGAPGAATTAADTAATAASVSTPTPITSAPPAAGSATIRVNTRLVQFDVVVTDKDGRPVKNLTAADFTVLQDGQAQSIRSFELHAPAAVEKAETSAASPAKPVSAAAPRNTFTNIPGQDAQSTWTVVLFDVLNTDGRDQAYARNQLLKLLKAVPRGEPVALFVLTRQLEMLQGFTQDPQQLVQAVELLDPAKSQLLTSMVERERTVTGIVNTSRQAVANVTTPVGQFDSGSLSYSQAARILQGYNDRESFRTTDRALFTLAAMKGLARAVSGYPGRKNLIWLSGSFPVAIEPDPASTDPFRNTRGFEEEIRTTSTLLATSRVAVYPVDVRGLQSKGTDISVATAESQVMNDVAPETAHGVIATSSSNLGATIGAETFSLANDRYTMKTIAQQTGGEAFVNTNDLSRVVQRSLDDGATYYTLAYTPPKEDAEGGYHRVAVQVPNKNLKLAYRRGYFSIPQPSATGAEGTAALRTALQPGMPPATSMLLTASFELPDATRTDVKVNYVINSNGVNFTDVPENKKRAQIDCMVIAFDSSGKEVAHASDTLDATIPASIYATVQAYGLPAHQLISLPPGRYNVRIGVMDRTTQQIGTVDAPLVIPGQAVAQR
jgi:VWFA-related protein